MCSIHVQDILHRPAQVRIGDEPNQGGVGAAHSTEVLQTLAPPPLSDERQTQVEVRVLVGPAVKGGAEGSLGTPEIVSNKPRSTNGSP